MSLRFLTPLLALTMTGTLSAGDAPTGEHPGHHPRPAPAALFERFDKDHDQSLSRAEFVRGMIALHHHRSEGGERPRPPRGNGDDRPSRDGENRPPRDSDDKPPVDGEFRQPSEEEDRPHRDGEGQPPRDGKPRPPRKGEGRPHHPPGDGENRPPRPPGEGDGDDRNRPGGDGPLERAFKHADKDNSGSLDKEEFKAALKHLPRPPDRHDGDGKGDRERPRPPRDQ